ncbi:MAG: hypothetical protein KH033_08720 [Clostridiales bacterium]|nr:hypothetical protein [Clostridiales bacterium]
MANFEDIRKANETIATTNIKGKEYAEVNQRIKAFRMVYPEGSIITDLVQLENGICTIKAVIKNGELVLGTGIAQEKESSSYINKTSYIENCETSAVGRALGMCGFGIDVSVCSAEELQNALNNQEKTAKKDEEKTSKTAAKEEAIQAEETQYATEEQVDKLNKYFANNNEARQKTLDKHKINHFVQMERKTAQALIDRIEAKMALRK